MLSSLLTFLHLIPLLLLSSLCSNVLCGDIVTHLPGFSGHLPFYLETGYVKVESWEMFYYFVKSEGNPSEDPVILWLTGGPGCSGFNALVYEIGPLRFATDQHVTSSSLPTLEYDPTNSWTKLASIIFLDWPIGGGFTFSSQPDADDALDDIITSIKIHEFLKKWYDGHPQFLSNPLYIAGDSYGGKMATIIAQTIADGNDDPPFLNLKGYLIGNPITGEALDFNTRVVFAHQVGIISDELFKEIEQACDGQNYYYSDNLQCIMALNKYRMVALEINENSILEPKCRLSSREKLAEFPLLPLYAPNLEYCKSDTHVLVLQWSNNDAVKEALHVKKGTIDYWTGCSVGVFLNFKRTMIPSTVKYHLDLVRRGYRALVYSGDKDITIPFLGTIAWIKSLNFSITEEWRSWHVDGQVAGYTETYGDNLIFATIKNAGHTAPEYQPETCFYMFNRWISHKPL